MSYFLSPHNLTSGHEYEIDGEEAAHVLFSRRIRLGELLEFQGPDGYRYSTEVIETKKNFLVIRTLEEVAAPEELKINITLFQALISEKALDFILQKGTELGVASICLFNAKNTPLKMSKDIFYTKTVRWEKILWEAAKQSGRKCIPKLEFLENTQAVAGRIKEFEEFLLMDENGEKTTSIQAPDIALCVGPEGGFSREEKDALSQEKNVKKISITPFTVRAETAAISGISIIQNLV